MTVDETVKAIQQAALNAAHLAKPLADTPETRAAYARGVRAMAGLVHASLKVAEEMAEQHKSDQLVSGMLKGYASSLSLIVTMADELIPPGYE